MGNLDFKASVSIIRGFFGRFGPVHDVFIPHKVTQARKSNFAFVRFGSSTAAHKAIAISDEKWPMRRCLVVRKAKPHPLLSNSVFLSTPNTCSRKEARYVSTASLAPRPTDHTLCTKDNTSSWASLCKPSHSPVCTNLSSTVPDSFL